MVTEIIQKISESLHVPLSIESDYGNVIQLAVTGENYVNNFNFILFIRGLIKHHLVNKIQYKKNNDELRISFSIVKRYLNNALIDKILTMVDDNPYLIDEGIDYDIKSITTRLGILLLGLYSNCTIEYDIIKQMVIFKLESIDTKSLSVTSALDFVNELNNNPNFTKKFVNGGNCDFDIMSKITSPEEIQQAALAYSEGNESLCKLLEFCFSNRIWTTACCKGHSDRNDKYGFVTFNLDYRNTRTFFNFLVGKLLDSNLNELCLLNFKSIPGYPECTLYAAKGMFYFGGTVNYRYDYVDQILQLVLQYAKEYVDVKRNFSLDDMSSHRDK